jgi:DNA polymerase eta
MPECDNDSVQLAGESSFTFRDLQLLGRSSVNSPLRVIALVDFDCFYAQCESVRLGLPEDQPLGVQQFKHVIAINYPARAAGLRKVVTAFEAKQKCPNIVLQHVPTWREGDTMWSYRDDVREHMSTDKSSLDYYRLQSRRAIEVVKDFLPASLQKIEKASIDEIFLDLSSQVHGVLLKRHSDLLASTGASLDTPLPKPWTELLDWGKSQLIVSDASEEDAIAPDWSDVALHIGAEIVQELRQQIHQQLRYTCSAGIAHNKILAKLAAGHNKPNNQTVVRKRDVNTFLSTYKFSKLRGLGGKLGQGASKAFNTDSIADLLDVTLKEMQSKLGPESGTWVYRAIRGIDYNEVTSRTQIQSMLSAKTFTPSISGLEQAERWLRIFGRLEEQEGRRPRTLAVHHHINGRFGPTRSRQTSIPPSAKLDVACLVTLAMSLLKQICREGPAWPCLTLSISVSDFSDADTGNQSIASFMTMAFSSSEQDSASRVPRQQIDTRPEQSSKKRTIVDFLSLDSSPATASFANDPESDARTMSSRKSSKVHRTTSEDSKGLYQCPNCSKAIPAADVLEHLDWHAAVDLRDEL